MSLDRNFAGVHPGQRFDLEAFILTGDRCAMAPQ
jgi:hypothetical protein